MHTQHAQHKARTTGHIHIHLSPPSVSLYVVSLYLSLVLCTCVLRVVAMRGEREEGAPVKRAEDDIRRMRFIIIGITACAGKQGGKTRRGNKTGKQGGETRRG